MIQKTESGLIVRVSRSRRRKHLPLKKYFAVFAIIAFVVLVCIFGLTFYTPWLLAKKYEPKIDAYVKDWFPENLEGFINGGYFFSHNFSAIVNVLMADDPPKTSALPTYKLWIANNALEKLDQDIVAFGMSVDNIGLRKKRRKVNAIYEAGDGSRFSGSLALRGARESHHMVWKPSLKFKFKNKEGTPEGYQDLVFIAPEDVSLGLGDWLSDELARQWGMLNSDMRLVRLFINNQFMGVYVMERSLDESLLIHSGRLPGPFFKLEHVDNRYLNRTWYPWDTPYGWQTIDISKAEGLGILGKAVTISKEITEWSPAKQPAGPSYLAGRFDLLDELIDKDVFAKYLALLCHGGEFHVDSSHNNAFWLDTTSGKLVPVLADVNGYGALKGFAKQLERPILKKENAAFVFSWIKNPYNLALFVDRLYELVRTFGSEENLEKTIRNRWEEMRPDVLADVHLSEGNDIIVGEVRQYIPLTGIDGEVEKFVEFVKTRNQWILRQLYQDKLSIISRTEHDFEMYLEGFSGIIPARKDGKKLVFGRGGNKETGQAPLLPSVSISKQFQDRIPYAIYRLPGKPEDYVFSHRLTGDEVAFSPPPGDLENLRAVEGVNMFAFASPVKDPVYLGPGEVVIGQTRAYNPGEPVIIRAGTKILLGPNVSLIFRGPLAVEGAPGEPVVVRPYDPNQPFGVIAVLGKDTAGTRIKYLDMEGGSVAQWFNLSFSGMFSVRDCPDVEIEKSRFGRNFAGDDGVHVARSKAKIRDSVFENAHSDAVDWDLVDGELSGNSFYNSGNDGIDLSMGHVRIDNNYCDGSGDKCVSAGEGVEVSIANSKFYRCVTGVAVKDSARATLENALFDGCKVSFNSYRKKWRWVTGGSSVIKNSRFLHSIDADVAGDDFSHLDFIGGLPQGLVSKGEIKIGALPPTTASPLAGGSISN